MKLQKTIFITAASVALVLTSCITSNESILQSTATLNPPQVSISVSTPEPTILSIPKQPTDSMPITPTMESYSPEIYHLYNTRNGDTLPTIARRFMVDAELVWKANLNLARTDFLDKDTQVTVPDLDFSSSNDPFLIIPDSEVVYGPGQVNLDVQTEVQVPSDGWLWQIEAGNDYLLPGWRVVQDIAMAYSVNPRLLLALIEYQSGLVTGISNAESIVQYPLNVQKWKFAKLPNQLMWAAEQINAGYYGWRHGRIQELTLAEGEQYKLDPRLNSGTVAIYSFFAPLYSTALFEQAIGPNGFAATYKQLFGDPFNFEVNLVEPGLTQPEITLPFENDVVWNFTGGPHNAWRDSAPWAAIDFAPQLAESGCVESNDWIVAPAPGVITRIQTGVLAQNLGDDGSELTGWTLIYVHLLPEKYKLRVGQHIEYGERLGRPSCEGDFESTGTHLHLARKYNGEWMPASGPPIFSLGDWDVIGEHRPYHGKLYNRKTGITIVACACVNDNQISKPSK